MSGLAGMFNRLQGQPDSYEKKYSSRSAPQFGRTLGAGTYGVVREADGPTGKVAIKIIHKKSVKHNEQMVYDELNLLQQLKHPHIIKFVDWFESRDKFYIVTELATGGELFDRICDQGKFSEKDASQTIKQVLDAVAHLHRNNVVHRDLKPENLLYVTKDVNSDLVLADFGIAKSLDDKSDSLKTMAGSFGYAAPEVMDNKGHGKPVDLWSLGVITYTLLCGYSPFRSENLKDLLEECTKGSVVFHERYWKEVSQDAKDFINCLIVADPERRWTCEQAMNHIWLSGENATEHDLGPDMKKKLREEIERRRAVREKFQNAILTVSLQNLVSEDGQKLRKVVMAMKNRKAEEEAESIAAGDAETESKSDVEGTSGERHQTSDTLS